MHHRSLHTVLAGFSVFTIALSRPVAAQDADSTAQPSYAPTTLPPWNPPRAVLAREPWEMALDFPLRLATLPVSAVGLLARNTMLTLEENSLVPRALLVLTVPSLYGVYAMPASLGDRTGMGGELLFAPTFARGMASVGVSGSTGGYSRFEAKFGTDLARFEYSNAWRPHDPFFGIGLGAEEGDEGSLSSSTETYRLTSRIPLGPVERGRPPRHAILLSAAERKLTMGEPQGDPEDHDFVRSDSPFEDAFDREQKGTLYGVTVRTDLRAGAPHWSRGVRVQAGGEWFDPEADPAVVMPALGPVPPGFASFQRYTLEAEGALSFYRDPRTVRLAVRVVDTELDTEKGPLLVFDDLASLGGSQGLAGFEYGRFRDLDAAVAKLSYIFPLAQHYELDIHVEGGGVWSDLQNQARLTDVETSYGILLRPRTRFAPVGAIGIEASREGVRFRFSLGSVE